MSLVPVTIFLMHVCMLSHLSHVWPFVTPWTVVHQPPLSNGPVQQARMLEWAAMSSSRGSSQPGIEWASLMFPALGFLCFFFCSGFCHTLIWISHGFICVPHPNPRSCLPLYPIPLGLPSAPALSTCLTALDSLPLNANWEAPFVWHIMHIYYFLYCLSTNRILPH